MKKMLMLGFIVLIFCSYVAAETGQLSANTRIIQLNRIEKNILSPQVSSGDCSSASSYLAKSDTIIENLSLNKMDSPISVETKLDAQVIQERNSRQTCPGLLAYSNTEIEGYFPPANNVSIADDIILNVAGGGDLVCYEIAFAYGAFVAPQVNVNAALYNARPDQGGQLIPGTEATWVFDSSVEVGYYYTLTAELATPVAIPEIVFLVMSKSAGGNDNGFAVAGAAEIGYTNDWFCMQNPGWICGYYFGGDPWAGFYAELYLDIDLEPCVTCPPGGILEAEPACGPNYVDTYNGGCNSNPPVFQAISSGDVICGQTGVFENSDSTISRDTDWFSFTLGEAKLVEWEVYGEAPMLAAIAKPGSAGCDDFEVLALDTANYCESVYLSEVLPAGTYWVIAMVDNFSTYWECEIPYIASFNTISLTPCVSCPPGGIPEGEPPCGPNYNDTFNGGCNSTPSVFRPISNNNVICGQTGVFDYSGDTYRDTDWFVFQVPEYSLVEWEAYGEAPMMVALIDPGVAMPDGCADMSILGVGVSQYCETATIKRLVEPGTYWAFVSLDTFNEFFACEIPYVATIHWEPADPEDCGPDTIFPQPFAAEVVYVNSDANSGIIVADDFSGLTEAITAVEWWGGNLNNSPTWHGCTKPNSNFVITFYQPGAVPGAVVYQKTVTAVKTQTLQFVFGNTAYGPVMKYRAELPSSVSIPAGWISIQAVDSGTCWFMWADSGAPPASGSAFVRDSGSGWELDADPDNQVDLAFCLIGGEPQPIPATSPVGISIALLVIGIMIALPMLRKSL